jgi:hypothetical protein
MRYRLGKREKPSNYILLVALLAELVAVVLYFNQLENIISGRM